MLACLRSDHGASSPLVGEDSGARRGSAVAELRRGGQRPDLTADPLSSVSLGGTPPSYTILPHQGGGGAVSTEALA